MDRILIPDGLIPYAMSEGENLFVPDYFVLRASADIGPLLISEFSNTTVEIAGEINGVHAVRLGPGASFEGQNFKVTETGSIFADIFGVYIRGHDSRITNEGLIQSEATALLVDAENSAGSTRIVNTGAIQGGAYSIYTKGIQAVHLDNQGLIASPRKAIELDDGADRVVNRGWIRGDINLGEGADFYDGRQGEIRGALFGGQDRDKMLGGAKTDILNGEEGDDSLTGGGGRDLLSGGSDADLFHFNAISDSGTTASKADHIIDFSASEDDKIILECIDANSRKSGDQDFRLIGSASFTGAVGELRATSRDGDLWLQGDVNGDRRTDFLIIIDDVASVRKSDFDL
jgi:Ca2+-binding RTX toxin-like protein